MGRFFLKKAFHGRQTFLGKNLWGGCSKMGGLMIRSCQGGAGVSQMTITFSSNLNTVNLHLKIKP